jgi:DNA-binding NtrC family response regulator
LAVRIRHKHPAKPFLRLMVEQGQFREDLYYRLSVFRIRTPALREHPEDIPHLANHLWRRISGEDAEPLSPDAEQLLGRHSWPGNVRELRAFLASVHALAGRPVFHLPIARILFRDRGYARNQPRDP